MGSFGDSLNLLILFDFAGKMGSFGIFEPSDDPGMVLKPESRGALCFSYSTGRGWSPKFGDATGAEGDRESP